MSKKQIKFCKLCGDRIYEPKRIKYHSGCAFRIIAIKNYNRNHERAVIETAERRARQKVWDNLSEEEKEQELIIFVAICLRELERGEINGRV